MNLGRSIATAALDSRRRAELLEIETLALRERALLLPLQEAPDQEWFRRHRDEMAALALATEEPVARRVHGAMSRWAGAFAQGRIPCRRRVIIQGLTLGPLRIATLPFEPLSAVGHAIRERIGQPSDARARVVGYANGCHAYLARASQYPVGGYEITTAWKYYGLPSNYREDAAEKVIEAAVGLCE